MPADRWPLWASFAVGGLWIAAVAALGGCEAAGGDFPWPELEPGLDDRAPLACAAPAEPPARLSAHPCYAGTPPAPVAGFVPYAVQSPFWSDGLAKDRAVAVPDGSMAAVRADGLLALPPGSIAVKDFRDGDRPIETRVLVVGQGGFAAGATYAWDEGGDDARLVAEDTAVEIAGGTWTVPGREACGECHGGPTGLLGLRVEQLNGELDYPGGRTANQIATWVNIGLLDPTALERPDRLDRLPSPGDPTGPVADRARAWLDASCAHCHRPGGDGGSNLDLRWTTPLDLMRACRAPPERGDPWDGEGRIVEPGRPERSVLLSRIATDDALWRMPPLGSAQIDQGAVDLVAAWVTQLTGCSAE